MPSCPTDPTPFSPTELVSAQLNNLQTTLQVLRFVNGQFGNGAWQSPVSRDRPCLLPLLHLRRVFPFCRRYQQWRRNLEAGSNLVSDATSLMTWIAQIVAVPSFSYTLHCLKSPARRRPAVAKDVTTLPIAGKSVWTTDIIFEEELTLNMPRSSPFSPAALRAASRSPSKRQGLSSSR